MHDSWLSLYGKAAARVAVYGTALNFRGALAALGAAVNAPPYQAPPRAPILYLKPRNTWLGPGEAVILPAGHEAVAVGPTLGVVIGQPTTRVSAAAALGHVAGYTIVNDLALPHSSYFRPAIQQQCRDGFCPIGPSLIEASAITDPGALELRAYINDQLRLTCSTAELIRPLPQLIADISDFMTLRRGDLLLVGLPANLPLARAGDRMAVEIDGLGRLENPLLAASAGSDAPAIGGAP